MLDLILLIYIKGIAELILPTHSMEQSPSWEADRFSASQEIHRIYGTWMFITAFTSARYLSLS